MLINFTEKQKELLKLLHSDVYDTYLIYGGGRSGKTFSILADIITTAFMFQGSRQLVARQHQNHIKASIWNDTLPKLLKLLPKNSYKTNEQELSVTIGESKIIFAGLDDKERTDKILGTEYCRIYLNEGSQISYSTYKIVLSRLAQKVEGLKNKIFIDLNPGNFFHWVYQMFFSEIEPESKKKIDTSNLAIFQINPKDNLENIDPEYIKRLETLSENERKRFLDGEFQNITGSIFSKFSEKHIIEPDSIPLCSIYYSGVDMITYAGVLLGVNQDKVYIIDELGGESLTANELNKMMLENWKGYNYKAVIDHNLGQAGTREITNSILADKSSGSVEAGINYINQLLEQDKLYISSRCTNLINSMPNYQRNDRGIIIKKDDHYIDALRMAIFTAVKPSFSFPKIGADGMIHKKINPLDKYYKKQRFRTA